MQADSLLCSLLLRFFRHLSYIAVFFVRLLRKITLEVIVMNRRRALFLLFLSTALMLCFFQFKDSRAVAVSAAPAPRRCIALTFDDGPSPQTTAALLDGLKERGAHATFFLIGEQIAGNEAIVRRMKDEGHQIGNHSFTHARLDAADAAALGEIQKTDDALRDVLGDGSYWIRPPWGFASEALKSAVTVPLIFWTLDTMDWSVRSKELVAHHIIENVRTSDIVLLHDLYDTSADAALQVIDVLGAQGYEFVTLEELFACSGVTPQAGHFYLRADEEVSW